MPVNYQREIQRSFGRVAVHYREFCSSGVDYSLFGELDFFEVTPLRPSLWAAGDNPGRMSVVDFSISVEKIAFDVVGHGRWDLVAEWTSGADC